MQARPLVLAQASGPDSSAGSSSPRSPFPAPTPTSTGAPATAARHNCTSCSSGPRPASGAPRPSSTARFSPSASARGAGRSDDGPFWRPHDAKGGHAHAWPAPRRHLGWSFATARYASKTPETHLKFHAKRHAGTAPHRQRAHTPLGVVGAVRRVNGSEHCGLRPFCDGLETPGTRLGCERGPRGEGLAPAAAGIPAPARPTRRAEQDSGRWSADLDESERVGHRLRLGGRTGQDDDDVAGLGVAGLDSGLDREPDDLVSAGRLLDFQRGDAPAHA